MQWLFEFPPGYTLMTEEELQDQIAREQAKIDLLTVADKAREHESFSNPSKVLDQQTILEAAVSLVAAMLNAIDDTCPDDHDHNYVEDIGGVVQDHIDEQSSPPEYEAVEENHEESCHSTQSRCRSTTLSEPVRCATQFLDHDHLQLQCAVDVQRH